MKRIMNTLVVPFWSDTFSKLRTDENVIAGHFRIGALTLETQFNSKAVIIAKVTGTLKPCIDTFATTLADNMSERISQYREGLICAGEFINEMTNESLDAHNSSCNSTCTMRQPWCDKFECPAIKIAGTAKHEAQEAKHREFFESYDNR